MLKTLQSMENRNWLILLFSIAAICVGLDQWTKWLAEEHLTYARPVTVTSFFDFTLLYNKGAAFSFLSNAGGWQRYFFTTISLVASIGISVWIVTLKGHQRLLAFGLAFVLGGAVGNLIDRALYGQVVDFLSFHWNGSYFPAFNLADSAITFGAGILIYDMIFNGQNDD